MNARRRPWASDLTMQSQLFFAARQQAGDQFWRTGLHGPAPPRKAWIGHEVLLRVKRLTALAHFHAPGGTVGQYLVALLVVNQIAQHDL